MPTSHSFEVCRDVALVEVPLNDALLLLFDDRLSGTRCSNFSGSIGYVQISSERGAFEVVITKRS
jgi:hypothetical protein